MNVNAFITLYYKPGRKKLSALKVIIFHPYKLEPVGRKKKPAE
ncbi:hypothetical protein JOC55_004226 [Paenibacillus sacheonensis]|nr:hypothetical protein [Paenibacillus sacheonensis]